MKWKIYRFEKIMHQKLIPKDSTTIAVQDKNGFSDGVFEKDENKWLWWCPCGGAYTYQELFALARRLKKVIHKEQNNEIKSRR